MKIIYNNIIPFSGFVCINLFGFLFIRSQYKSRIESNTYYYNKLINHESIHTELMKDFFKFIPITFIQLLLGGIIFYLIYFFEWLFKVLFIYPFSHEAYRNISFEEEAYTNENNLSYLENRKIFALWRK